MVNDQASLRLANKDFNFDVELRLKDGEYVGSIGDRQFLIQKSDLRAFELENIVVNKKTKFQDVLVGDTDRYGRILVLDGDLQSSEYDETLYHESLVQPAMLSHAGPKDVLIVGTGEGATLREALKHEPRPRITAVDIDQEVVEICEEYLESWHGGFMRHPNVEHVFADGFQFLRDTEKTFDVAVIDIVSDWAEGPAERLYSPEFYQLVKNKLNPGGIVSVQSMNLSHIDYENAGHRLLRNSLKQVFPEVHSYSTMIPSFFAAWSFLLASDWFDPNKQDADFFQKRIDERIVNGELVHYDGEYLKSRFTLCKKTREKLS